MVSFSKRGYSEFVHGQLYKKNNPTNLDFHYLERYLDEAFSFLESDDFQRQVDKGYELAMIFCADAKSLGVVDVYRVENDARKDYVCSLGRTMTRESAIVFAEVVANHLHRLGYKCEDFNPIPTHIVLSEKPNPQFSRRWKEYYLGS